MKSCLIYQKGWNWFYSTYDDEIEEENDDSSDPENESIELENQRNNKNENKNYNWKQLPNTPHYSYHHTCTQTCET